MKYAKLLLGDFAKDSRDKREVEVARGLGWDVTILSPVQYIRSDDEVSFLLLEGERVSRRQSWLKRKCTILKNWRSYVAEIQKRRFDILSCHDLRSLFLGYLSTFGSKKTLKLV